MQRDDDIQQQEFALEDGTKVMVLWRSRLGAAGHTFRSAIEDVVAVDGRPLTSAQFDEALLIAMG
jgi:hypothetical protein